MKKEHLDKFIEDIDITRMPIREIIATAYELGRLHEKAGIDAEERDLTDSPMQRLQESDRKKVNEVIKDADICFLLCNNCMECSMAKERQSCGTFQVLKDRYGDMSVINLTKVLNKEDTNGNN